MTRLNIKSLMLLTLAMLAMVSAEPRFFRGGGRMLEAASDEGDEPKDVLITKSKGKDGAADEIDLDVKLKSCEEGSNECKTIEDDADDVEDVSLAMFSSVMAEEMVAALEKDEDDDDDDNRKLGRCKKYRKCYRIRYCKHGRCWYRYYCKYFWRCW